MATMDYAEINVDQKYHRHIIGKGGASGKYSTVVTLYQVVEIRLYDAVSWMKLSLHGTVFPFTKLLPPPLVSRIKTETGTSIIIPPDTEKSDCIRIEGDPMGVQAAKNMLLEMAAKMVRSRIRIFFYTSYTYKETNSHSHPV